MHNNMYLISLIATIFIIVFAGPIIPVEAKSFMYSLSLSLKEVIVFFLPVLIFSLIFKTSVALAEKATKMVLIILVLVCVSNLITTGISHYIGVWIYNFDMSIIEPDHSKELTSMWNFTLYKVISNDKALFSGLMLGLFLTKFYHKRAKLIADKLDYLINKMLQVLTYIIPFFIAGFISKLEHDGVFSLIIKDYLSIFVIAVTAQMVYIFAFYLVINKFDLQKAIHNIKNILPAAITACSAMSSTAGLPLTIIGAGKNAHDKDLAKAVVPATINIHLIGDCFVVPIAAFAILKTFNIPEPSFYEYMVFVGYFIATKFSIATVPGGGIFVMLPILEKTLGFTPPMLSMITAIYLLFDPILAFINVLGNGAFAKLIDNINYHMLNK